MHIDVVPKQRSRQRTFVFAALFVLLFVPSSVFACEIDIYEEILINCQAGVCTEGFVLRGYTNEYADIQATSIASFSEDFYQTGHPAVETFSDSIDTGVYRVRCSYFGGCYSIGALEQTLEEARIAGQNQVELDRQSYQTNRLQHWLIINFAVVLSILLLWYFSELLAALLSLAALTYTLTSSLAVRSNCFDDHISDYALIIIVAASVLLYLAAKRLPHRLQHR